MGRRCLVLLDELGKGTEVVAGSALAAAVLEDLVRAGAAGVFATHLHDLVFLMQPLKATGGLEYWAMEVTRAAATPDGSPHMRPTRRVLVGQVCMRSLALQVAASCGLQPEVLEAAARYERQLGDMMERAREGMYGVGVGLHVTDHTVGMVGAVDVPLPSLPSQPPARVALSAGEASWEAVAEQPTALLFPPERGGPEGLQGLLAANGEGGHLSPAPRLEQCAPETDLRDEKVVGAPETQKSAPHETIRSDDLGAPDDADDMDAELGLLEAVSSMVATSPAGVAAPHDRGPDGGNIEVSPTAGCIDPRTTRRVVLGVLCHFRFRTWIR